MAGAGGATQRGKTQMVDTGELRSVLDKLNKEVIPALSQLRIDIEVIRAKQEEVNKSSVKEATERRDILKEHDRILRGFNGNIGLITRIKDVEDWINVRSRIEWILISLVLAAFVEGTVGFVILIFKILPVLQSMQ